MYLPTLVSVAFFLSAVPVIASAQPANDVRDPAVAQEPGSRNETITPAIPGAPTSPDVPATPSNSRNVRTTDNLPPGALLPGNPEVTYVITPPAARNGDVPLVKGCWAKLYDEDGLKGDSITMYGPIGLPNPSGAGVFDIDWKDRISSIAVGPHARVFIYDNNNFRDLLLNVNAGESVNINNALSYFDEIKSIKIECNKAQRAPNAGTAVRGR